MKLVTSNVRYSIDRNAPENLAGQLRNHLTRNHTGQLPKELAKWFMLQEVDEGRFYAYTPRTQRNCFSAKKPLHEPSQKTCGFITRFKKRQAALLGSLIFTSLENFKKRNKETLALLRSETNTQLSAQLDVLAALFDVYPRCNVALNLVPSDQHVLGLAFKIPIYKVSVYGTGKKTSLVLYLEIGGVDILNAGSNLHQNYGALYEPTKLKKQIKLWEQFYMKP